VGHIAVLDAVVKRKIPNSRRESNPRLSIVRKYSTVAYYDSQF